MLIMSIKQSKDQRDSMKPKAEAFYLRMQTGVPHGVSQTTVNQRNQEIKASQTYTLKGFSERIFML